PTTTIAPVVSGSGTSNTVSDSATSIPVTSIPAGLPSSGTLLIDSEQIGYSAIAAAITTTLHSAIPADATLASIPVASTTSLPTAGTIQIDSEQITYTGVDTTNNLLTGLTRGVDGTTAAAHASGATVTVEPQYLTVATTGGRGANGTTAASHT